MNAQANETLDMTAPDGGGQSVATDGARAVRRAPEAGNGKSRARHANFGAVFAWTACGALLLIVGSSGVTLRRIRTEMASSAVESAPATMKLVEEAFRERVEHAPETIRRLVNDTARIRSVLGCRFTLESETADAGAGRGATSSAISAGSVTGGEGALRLVSTIRGTESPRTAELEVWFDTGSTLSSGLTGEAMLASVGLVGPAAAAGLTALAWWMRQRLSSVRKVEESLRDFASGREQSYELLAIQQRDQTDALVESWNKLIASAAELQSELHARQDLETIARMLDGVGSASLQPILDALPIGVIQLEGDGTLGYCNFSAERMLGIAHGGAGEGALGVRRVLSECVTDPALASALASMNSGQQAVGGSIEVTRQGGSDASSGQTVIRLTPLPPAREDGAESVILVQDVSQQVEANRSRDAFLANITHELRTPLTNIGAYAETLTEDCFNDEATRRECYNVITKETRRLSRMIEDVLSVSQIESGASRLERAELRVDHMLRQAVQDMQANADERGIQLSLRVPSKVPPVAGDRHRLHQVWINLLGNAIKYTPESGTVSVTVQSDDHSVRVLVTDTGIGIAPEHHQRIFEKFYRVPGSEKLVEGTGLGLAITRDLVRMHGGSIRVESALGEGSTFVVELPRARESSSSRS